MLNVNFIVWVIAKGVTVVESTTSTAVIVVPLEIPVPVTKSPNLGIPFSPRYKYSPVDALPLETVYVAVIGFGVPPPVINVTAPLDLLGMLGFVTFVIVGLLKSTEVPSGTVILEESNNVGVAVIPITTTRSFIPVITAGVIISAPPLAPVIVVVTLSITSIGSQGANLATDIWSSLA